MHGRDEPAWVLAERHRATGQTLCKLCAALHITPLKSPQTNGTIKRHGRTLQRPHRGRAAKPPPAIRRKTGHRPASIRPALQPTAPAIRPGPSDAVQGMKHRQKIGLGNNHTSLRALTGKPTVFIPPDRSASPRAENRSPPVHPVNQQTCRAPIPTHGTAACAM